MIMNFIAFIICALAAVVQGYLGNIGWVFIESILALINLSYVIMDLHKKKIFKSKK